MMRKLLEFEVFMWIKKLEKYFYLYFGYDIGTLHFWKWKLEDVDHCLAP